MGNLPSRELRQERRSARRLSKPPTNTSSFHALKAESAGHRVGVDNDDALPDTSMLWKSPWTGDLLPKSSPDIDDSEKPRVRSFPSFSVLHPGPARPSISGNRRWSNFGEADGKRHERSLSHPSPFVSPHHTRRSSVIQLRDSKPRSRQPMLRETRKAPIFYLAASDRADDVQEAPIEQLTTESLSAVGDRHLPLIRRKSLFKPGVATRPSQECYQKPLSLIKQEDDDVLVRSTLASRSSQWPLYDSNQPSLEYPTPPATYKRASSPIALDYSHLGGLKRGSLRIVNGSASPTPGNRTHHYMPLYPSRECGANDHSLKNSQRCMSTSWDDMKNIRLDSAQPVSFLDHNDFWAYASPSECSSTPGSPQFAVCELIGLQGPDGTQDESCEKGVTPSYESPVHAQVSSAQDDIPESPFSLKKFPTMNLSPRRKQILSGHAAEDEAINLTFDKVPGQRSDISASNRAFISSDTQLKERKSRSLANPDSGYSSVSSNHSERTDESSSLSQSPPHCSPAKHTGSNAVQDETKKSRDKLCPRSCGLRRKSKEADLRSIPLSRRPSFPLLTLSTMCREKGDKNAPKLSRKTHHRHHSSGERARPSRFYARLGPQSVPSVPARTITYILDSDTDDANQDSALEIYARRRRFSTSQLKLGLRRSGFVEQGTLYRSGGEDFVIENPPRNTNWGNSNANANKSIDTNPCPANSKSIPSLHSKERSLSEPRTTARRLPWVDRKSDNRSQPPLRRRRQQRQQSPMIHSRGIPPVPSLPSMFEIYNKAPQMRQQASIEPSVEFSRGRARTRSMDHSRKKLAKVSRVSLQYATVLNQR